VQKKKKAQEGEENLRFLSGKSLKRLNILPRKAEHTAMSPRHPSLALERPLTHMSRLREIDG